MEEQFEWPFTREWWAEFWEEKREEEWCENKSEKS